MSSLSVFRPRLHFTPKKNWINDPVGCVFFEGLYHLFYQYNPHDIQWGPMHWGHAVSRDFLNWKEQDIALYPDKETGMIFSGSAVIDRDNHSGLFPDKPGLIVFYTGHVPGESEETSVQHQCMAYSRDSGATWIPWKHNPVIPNPGLPDFRDPKVLYHSQSQSWIMVLAAGQEVQFFRSSNLLEWAKAGSFRTGSDKHHVLECPDLFSLPHPDESDSKVWILVVSTLSDSGSSHSPVFYYPGHFDGFNFDCSGPQESGQIADYGNDFYATQSWFGLNDRSIWIAWANHWSYARDVPADDWRGIMSLPRELSLARHNGSLLLRQTPVSEFETGGITAPFPDSAPVDGVHDIHYKIDNPEYSVVLEFRYNNSERLSLKWDPADRSLVLDRSGVSRDRFHPDFKLRPVANITLSNNQILDIRVILDASLIEVFALDGLVTMTSLIFPKSELKEILFTRGSEHIHIKHHRVKFRNTIENQTFGETSLKETRSVL